MTLLLDPGARPVVAHRGNSAHAPENTLEALEQGVSMGADALEFDVRITRDGHPVVIHDAGVERTTDGEGLVAALTLAQLGRLDAGFRFTMDGGRTFPNRGRGLAIPTLNQVLDAFPSTPIIVEIKASAASVETKRLLERHGAERRCVVGSFSAETIAPFQGSAFPRFAVRREVAQLYARALLAGRPARLPYDALCIPPAFRGLPLPVLRMARLGRRCGVPTHVWTVDDPARARRFWDGGVNAVISNDPAVILAAAGRARGSRIPASLS